MSFHTKETEKIDFVGRPAVGLEEARTSASRGDIGGSEGSSGSADAAAAW